MTISRLPTTSAATATLVRSASPPSNESSSELSTVSTRLFPSDECKPSVVDPMSLENWSSEQVHLRFRVRHQLCVERLRRQDAHARHGPRWDLRTVMLQTTSSFKQIEERVDIIDWVFKCQEARGRPTEDAAKLFSTMRRSGDRGASFLNWFATALWECVSLCASDCDDQFWTN